MKRSSQIGLAAAGVVLVATVWSMTGEDAQENLVYNNVSECLAAAQLSASQCETALSQATAARLNDAPKFRSQNECASSTTNYSSTISDGPSFLQYVARHT